jgi:hypothetical protein
MAKITDNEKQEFDKLYEYVKKILGYGEDMALPKFMVMRLKGLSEGKFYCNNKVKKTAQYSYQTILLTFMYSKDKINKALQTKSFDNEQNKFNYIMAIVQNNINDVVIRLKNVKKAEQKIQTAEIPDYDIKVDKNKNQSNQSNQPKDTTFNSLTNNLW